MLISFRKICLLFILLENWFLPIQVGFDFRLTYILYFIFIAIYPFTYRLVRTDARTVITVFVLFMILLAAPVFGGHAYLDSVRQVSLISFNVVFSWLLLNAYSNDIRRLFLDYCDVVYFAAIVGIVQFVSQIVGFRPGADYSYLGFEMQNFDMTIWHIQSWFQEPSFFAIVLLPVAFAAICRLMGLSEMITKQKAIVVLLALVLTQAASGLLGLIICLAIVVNRKYSLLKSPLLMGSAVGFAAIIAIGFYSIPKVKERIDDTAGLFFRQYVSAQDIESVNISTYGIFSNYRIAAAALMDHPVFGYGLGSYQEVYHLYLYKVLPRNQYTDVYMLNDRDANSLLLRLAAETGFFGLVLFGGFLLLFRIRRLNLKTAQSEQIEYWIINSGMYVVILIRLLRQGHYTMLGFVLVLMLFYLSKVEYRRTKGLELSDDPQIVAH